MAKKEDTPTPVLGESSLSPLENSDPRVIAERYKVIEILGQGGMGKVYLAVDTLLNRKAAVKVLSIADQGDEYIARFQQEARAASQLRHPGIVTPLDFGVTEDGKPFFVMEYIEGLNLSERTEQNGLLQEDEFISIFTQVARAMAHAHGKGIIHRDLKPSNIVIQELDQNLRAIVLDFGIAKILHADTDQVRTRTGQMIGSPKCISPEQISCEPVDARSDVYSLGCVMFEAITGFAPYEGKTALDTLEKHLNAPVPSIDEQFTDTFNLENLNEIIQKCLAKDPDARYQSMNSLIDDLKRRLNDTKNGAIATDQKSKMAIKKPPPLMLFVFLSVIFLSLIIACFVFLNQSNSTVPKVIKERGRSDPLNSLNQQLKNNSPEVQRLFGEYDTDYKWLKTAKEQELMKREAVRILGVQIESSVYPRLLKCSRLKRLVIARTNINEELIRCFGQISSLEHLSISISTFSDKKAFYHFKKLQNLEGLVVRASDLRNQDLGTIGELKNLKMLSLESNPGINDQGLRKLTGLQNLQIINLVECAVSPAGVKVFEKHPDELLIFVGKNPLFSDSVIREINKDSKSINIRRHYSGHARELFE